MSKPKKKMEISFHNFFIRRRQQIFKEERRKAQRKILRFCYFFPERQLISSSM